MKDNVLVFATDEEEHDKRLKAVLKRLAKAGTTLNPNKCSFKQPNLRFFRHVLNKDSLSPYPEKTEAIRSLPPPKTIPELHRLLRMNNQLGKFSGVTDYCWKIPSNSSQHHTLLSIHVINFIHYNTEIHLHVY